MAHYGFTVALLFLCSVTAADADTAVSCYRIEPATVAGIVCADVLLTLVVVVCTYRWASSRRQRRDRADKVYMNVRANCKA
uniref:Hematopoietic cell signal transducer n=1 Tax=Salarias fasciatus TaxID=181472 RepID=A0A672FCW3_SALFA